MGFSIACLTLPNFLPNIKVLASVYNLDNSLRKFISLGLFSGIEITDSPLSNNSMLAYSSLGISSKVPVSMCSFSCDNEDICDNVDGFSDILMYSFPVFSS